MDALPVPVSDSFDARLDRLAREHLVRTGRLAPVPRPAATSMVAAAKRVDANTRAERTEVAKRHGKNVEDWQRTALEAFRIPELHRAATFVGDCMSRIRWYPAVRPTSDDDPVPLDTTTLVGETEVPVVTDAERKLIDDAWRRIVEGSRGGFAETMRQMAINLFQVGDCWLVGKDAPVAESRQRSEEWFVASIFELRMTDAGWKLFDSRSDNTGTLLVSTEEVQVAVHRVWTRDPFHSASADAPLSAMQVEATELMWLTRAIMAGARGRSMNGILVVAQEATLVPQMDTAPGTQPPPDQLEEDWLYHVETALSDPTSVANAAPFWLRMPADLVDKVKWLTPPNPQAGQAAERHELILRLLRGADVPLENIIGLGDTSTYANAKLVTQQTYDTHLAPKAEGQAESIAEGYLRNAVLAAGLPPELARRVCVGIDPSNLIGRPEQAENAREAYDRGEADGEWLRETHGVPETHAPSEAERLNRERSLTVSRLAGAGYDGTDILEVLGMPAMRWAQTTGGAQVASLGAGQPGMIASAAGDRFSKRLAAIEARARDRITALLSALTVRAAEKLGAQATTRARKVPDLSVTLRGVQHLDVPRTLGRVMVASLGLDEQDTLRAVFASGETQITETIRQAHRDVLATIRASAEDDWLSDDELAAIEAEQDENTNAAWVWLLGAAPALAAAWIFGESAKPAAGLSAPIGEYNPNLAFPPGPVNTVLSIAGGADGELTNAGLTSGSGAPAPGLVNGPINSGAADAAGWLQVAYTWEVGSPERPYEPHQDLAGFEFLTWDDPALVNPSGWPDSPIYRPGDHLGCVVAGTIVSGPAVSAETLRWYEGSIVELTTASGQFLAVTPNHPVLTAQGWVAAGLLDEGDHVVRCLDSQGATDLVPAQHQVEARCEDLFATLRVTPGVMTCRVPVAAEHFDGDGANSEVAVVAGYGELGDNGVAVIGEPSGHAGLAVADDAGSFLASARSAFAGLDAVGLAPLGSVSSDHSGHALLRGSLGGAEQGRFAHGASHDAVLVEDARNHVAADAEALGKSLDGLAPFVSLDEITAVKVSDFRGHVLNLHTEPNWFVAGNLIVHNCECIVETRFERRTDSED